MRKNDKVLLDAKEQLVFGTALVTMRQARDHLRDVHPTPKLYLKGLSSLGTIARKASSSPRSGWN